MTGYNDKMNYEIIEFIANLQYLIEEITVFLLKCLGRCLKNKGKSGLHFCFLFLTRSLREPGWDPVQSLWRFQNLVWSGLTGWWRDLKLNKYYFDVRSNLQ